MFVKGEIYRRRDLHALYAEWTKTNYDIPVSKFKNQTYSLFIIEHK